LRERVREAVDSRRWAMSEVQVDILVACVVLLAVCGVMVVVDVVRGWFR